MMFINLKEHVYREGEFIIGADVTGSHACYLIYGVIRGNEEREISPGEGHEEILLVIEGNLSFLTENEKTVLTKGQAVYLKGAEKAVIRANEGMTAIYVIAGGHSDASHHH